MMPANNYGGFSQSSDTLTQSDDEALQALALQVMAENLTPQQTEAIYALLQDEWAQQPEQKPTPQPTAQADPQRSTQQGAAGNLPLESMASAYGTLQHESMHPMQQAHQSTKEAHDLLPEIEEALSHMPLQQQDHEWISEIHFLHQALSDNSHVSK